MVENLWKPWLCWQNESFSFCFNQNIFSNCPTPIALFNVITHEGEMSSIMYYDLLGRMISIRNQFEDEIAENNENRIDPIKVPFVVVVVVPFVYDLIQILGHELPSTNVCCATNCFLVILYIFCMFYANAPCGRVPMYISNATIGQWNHHFDLHLNKSLNSILSNSNKKQTSQNG